MKTGAGKNSFRSTTLLMWIQIRSKISMRIRILIRIQLIEKCNGSFQDFLYLTTSTITGMGKSTSTCVGTCTSMKTSTCESMSSSSCTSLCTSSSKSSSTTSCTSTCTRTSLHRVNVRERVCVLVHIRIRVVVIHKRRTFRFWPVTGW